jgi:hypothetical protein
LLIAIACGLVLGCADHQAAPPKGAPASSAAAALGARPFPPADRLFRRDAHFLGADAAVSIALAGERVLWLFGDSFIGTTPGAAREGARMVRNSVGVQSGRDPVDAELEVHTRTAADGGAASFFPEQDDAWFWPGHGVYLDGVLTLFLQRMRADQTPGGLGFRSAGWTAVRVREPNADPSSWQLEPLPTPDTDALGLVGVAVVSEGAFVYAYAVREPGDHALMLLRWSRADFTRGDLRQPTYFGGPARGFGSGPPAVVMADGAAEFSVSRTVSGRYVEVQSRGFGAAPVALRFAPALEGPWSALTDVYLPEEASSAGVLLYAARAHPELRSSSRAPALTPSGIAERVRGGATGADDDLLITYASNTLDAARLLSDLSLYFPRFVRARVP